MIHTLCNEVCKVTAVGEGPVAYPPHFGTYPYVYIYMYIYVLSVSLYIAMVADASNRPQNDAGNYLAKFMETTKTRKTTNNKPG